MRELHSCRATCTGKWIRRRAARCGETARLLLPDPPHPSPPLPITHTHTRVHFTATLCCVVNVTPPHTGCGPWRTVRTNRRRRISHLHIEWTEHGTRTHAHTHTHTRARYLRAQCLHHHHCVCARRGRLSLGSKRRFAYHREMCAVWCVRVVILRPVWRA